MVGSERQHKAPCSDIAVQVVQKLGQKEIEPVEIVFGFAAAGTESVPYAVGSGKADRK